MSRRNEMPAVHHAQPPHCMLSSARLQCSTPAPVVCRATSWPMASCSVPPASTRAPLCSLHRPWYSCSSWEPPPFHHALNLFLPALQSLTPEPTNRNLGVMCRPKQTVTPKGYRIAVENRTLTADRAFYVPGAQEDSWNKVSCRSKVQGCIHQICMPAASYRLSGAGQPAAVHAPCSSDRHFDRHILSCSRACIGSTAQGGLLPQGDRQRCKKR